HFDSRPRGRNLDGRSGGSTEREFAAAAGEKTEFGPLWSETLLLGEVPREPARAHVGTSTRADVDGTSTVEVAVRRSANSRQPPAGRRNLDGSGPKHFSW